VQGTATAGDEVIVTLDRITRELRDKLGESPQSVSATRPAREVMTPSFAAFRRWLLGSELHGDSRFLDAREQAREALRLDPDFVNAWVLLASSFWNTGLEDSARYAYEEALGRTNRLTDERSLYIKATITSLLDYQLIDGLDYFDRLVRVKPTYYANQAVVLEFLGRDEEALNANLKTMEMMPFGPGNIICTNTTDRLIVLGRYSEARQMISDIPNPQSRERREIYLALALSDWARADSIISNGILGSRSPSERETFKASLKASRGALRTVVSRSMPETAISFQSHELKFCSWRVHFLTIAGMKELVSVVPACGDTTVPGLIVQGIRKALSGDTQAAASILNAIELNPQHLQRKYKTDIIVVRAFIDAARGEWEEVIQALRPLTERGQIPLMTTRLSIRWLVAQAYDQQRQFEQAAEAFKLVISPVQIEPGDLYFRASYVSLAHYRLVPLYAQLGRLEEARQSLAAFEAMFTNPDPELAPMLEQARSAIEKLEG
jgi:tetratricopeptide (TPR) repeat protein